MSPRLLIVTEQIRRTRAFTHMVLEHTPQEWWRRMPPGCPSNVAWQIGHTTWAQYALAVQRVASSPDQVTGLLPEGFAAAFGRGTTPREAVALGAPAELRALFDRVHERLLNLLENCPDSRLDEPATHPNGFFTDKLGSLYWSARHEMLHAGQIGLIRRCLGEGPFR